jgi:Mrp family chromosome partitioning ATPase
VVIVDAAAASPRLYDVFGTPPSPGVLGVLTGEEGGLDAAMRPVRLSNDTGIEVTVLPLGSSDREAADLLSGPSFASLVAELRDRFDVVVLDTDPIRDSAASLAVSMFVDEVCVVARSRADSRRELRLTVDRLRSVGGCLGSVVVNGVRH